MSFWESPVSASHRPEECWVIDDPAVCVASVPQTHSEEFLPPLNLPPQGTVCGLNYGSLEGN